VGDDLAGISLTRDLEERDVDTRMQVRGNTGTIVVQIDLSGERTMFPSRGASGMLEKVDPAWLEDVKILHITAYSLEVEPTRSSVIAAAKTVHEAGGLVSFDISSLYIIEALGEEQYLQYMKEISPDFISANRDEAARLQLAEGANATLFPNATVLARNGAEATRVYRGGELIATVPVKPAEVIRDLTGAGDAFNAAFLASYLEDGDLPEVNVRRAHSLARRVLACPGASEQPPADAA